MEEYTFTADKFVFKVVKSLRYSKDDVWVKTENDVKIRIGLTDFAQRSSGDIVFTEVEPAGNKVVRGKALGNYETIKLVQDILSPVDGVITEVNPLLESRPEVINSDPYNSGWIAVIQPEKIEELLSSEEYFELMKSKINQEMMKIKGL